MLSNYQHFNIQRPKDERGAVEKQVWEFGLLGTGIRLNSYGRYNRPSGRHNWRVADYRAAPILLKETVIPADVASEAREFVIEQIEIIGGKQDG